MVALDAADCDEYVVWSRGVTCRCLSSHAIKLIVEVLVVEGTTSGDAKRGLEGWQGVLVLEHLGDASG